MHRKLRINQNFLIPFFKTTLDVCTYKGGIEKSNIDIETTYFCLVYKIRHNNVMVESLHEIMIDVFIKKWRKIEAFLMLTM